MYRKDFREIEREGYWTLPRVAAGVVTIGLTLTVVGFIFKPFAVVDRVTNPDRIIATYEWFHDANGKIKARVGQIKAHKVLLADTTDGSERSRLRIELSAQQQSCRDLVGQYNANATKTTHEIFMGKEAPRSFNSNICE